MKGRIFFFFKLSFPPRKSVRSRSFAAENIKNLQLTLRAPEKFWARLVGMPEANVRQKTNKKNKKYRCILNNTFFCADPDR